MSRVDEARGLLYRITPDPREDALDAGNALLALVAGLEDALKANHEGAGFIRGAFPDPFCGDAYYDDNLEQRAAIREVYEIEERSGRALDSDKPKETDDE